MIKHIIARYIDNNLSKDLYLIIINNLVITYTSGGISKDATTIYSIEQDPSKITMPFRILWLNSSNLYVPNSKGSYNLTLKLGNTE
ncbi:MAG: hypothetical protein QW050_00285, partial [Candidatus Nitrosocaldaceae archaeon]